MAHFEKQLSSQEIYQGRVFTVTKDTVQLENGAEGTREVVHHHGGACVAALTEDGRVYLVRQFRYAFGQEIWELPAGKLEPGEDPLEAAKRELGEEAGLAADHWQDLHPVWPTVGYCNEIIYTMTLVCCYPIGVIKMVDSGSLDEKIIAIPFGDPTYNGYYDIHELPAHVFDEMMHFFEVYKSLEHKQTTVKEICHRDEAVEIINKCISMYKDKFGK